MKKNNLNKFFLKNKISIILGGNGLIGKDICKTFIDAGSIIHVLDINNSKKFKTIKNYHFHYFDLKDRINIESNFKKIINKIKKVNVFVNTSFPISDDWISNNFDQVNLNSLNDNITYQLTHSAWISKEIANLMKKNNTSGSIIHLGSIYGLLGQDLEIYKNLQMRENMTYSIIKGGIINLSRQMASYYGQYNIRINTVSPGGISGHIKGTSQKQDINFIKNYSNKVPLKRLCKTSEVAPVVLFIASDASSYITGTNIMVDGGWSAI